MASAIRVHQVIHGYRAGHQLLQASLTLPSDVQRTMLIQSDLSGPSLVPGFEEYVTGYPIDELGKYVLARTWYAPEMERPGCVWTHSLLVDYADLARIENLVTLTREFRRPSRSAVDNAVVTPLVVEVTGDTTVVSDMVIAAHLFAALYGQPEAPVVLLHSDSQTHEELVLAVWSQQWPRLRRSFRFCSGALSIGAEGVQLDLAVAPIVLGSALRRDLPSALFVEKDSPPDPVWTRRALQAFVVAPQAVRAFFSSYGADVSHARRAWNGLANAFEWRADGASRPQTQEAVRVLAEHFPTAEDARRLKTDLLTGQERLFPIDEVLYALATFDHPTAFDADALQARDHAAKLWDSDRDAAGSLLRQLSRTALNSLGEEIVTALCSGVGPSLAVELDRLQPGILPLLVERIPALTQAPAVWQVPRYRKTELLRAIARVGPEAVRAALPAVLAGNNDDIADDVVAMLQSDASSAIVGALSEGPLVGSHLRLGPRWEAAIARSPAPILSWIQEKAGSVESLALASRVLDPRSRGVRAVPIATWLAMLAGSSTKLNEADRFRAALFLLGPALGSRTPEAGALIARCYADVYRAGRLSAWLPWEWLDDDLPTRSRWRRWDRCERLSLAVVEAFTPLDRSLQDFVDATRDIDAFEQALDVCIDVRGGRELFTRLRIAASRGVVVLNRGQDEALRDH